MNKLKIFVVVISIFFAAGNLEASELLEEGKKSFVLVVEDEYKEMGSPEMTEEVAEKLDRRLFMRDIGKQPAFSPKVNISWSAYKDSITAIISGEEDGQAVKVRFIWRPGKDLEIIDPDAVLEW